MSLAAVVGVPHPSHGEEVKAFVVRAPGAVSDLPGPSATALTEAELIAWCKQNMAAYKYPRLVEFRDSHAGQRALPAARARPRPLRAREVSPAGPGSCAG